MVYRNDSDAQPIPIGTLNELDEYAAKVKEGEYRMMIADRMISIIQYAGKQVLWEKAFFIDDQVALETQMSCITGSITSPQASLPPAPPAGTFHNLTHFYAPCVDQVKPVGTVQIIHTGFGRGSHGGTQLFELWTPDGQLVASFQRLVHQGTPFMCEGYPEHDLVTMSVQSININVLKEPVFESNLPLSEILLEYAHVGEVHYTTLQSNIRLHAADVFGGLLIPVNVSTHIPAQATEGG